MDVLIGRSEGFFVSATRTMTSPRREGAVTPAHRKSTFRPEIQGLRSLAVLMVVAYHVWFGRVSGGVDVFLLVSAFLMTLQFVARYEQHVPMAILKHWLHLFRRLLPAAVTVVMANVLVYKDGNHVTATYMKTLVPTFKEGFLDATGW
jgi:peptidoglycan/LPS O-acetylase OafA/YrhL